jgi:hypothetical protein
MPIFLPLYAAIFVDDISSHVLKLFDWRFFVEGDVALPEDA